MRLEPIRPEQLNEEQRPLYEEITTITAAQKMSFVMARADGALVGPFNPFLHFPQFGCAAWDMNVALSKHTTLPKPVHELIILVTGARFTARYEIYAHEDVASRAGLSKTKVSTLASGNRPVDLTEHEGIAYDATSVLMRGAQMPETTYQLALGAFGGDGVAELMFLTGFYCLISVLLNGFDAAVPGRAEI